MRMTSVLRIKCPNKRDSWDWSALSLFLTALNVMRGVVTAVSHHYEKTKKITDMPALMSQAAETIKGYPSPRFLLHNKKKTHLSSSLRGRASTAYD